MSSNPPSDIKTTSTDEIKSTKVSGGILRHNLRNVILTSYQEVLRLVRSHARQADFPMMKVDNIAKVGKNQ
jgi:hypothetical protein